LSCKYVEKKRLKDIECPFFVLNTYLAQVCAAHIACPPHPSHLSLFLESTLNVRCFISAILSPQEGLLHCSLSVYMVCPSFHPKIPTYIFFHFIFDLCV
jgi:hypothetical protein